MINKKYNIPKICPILIKGYSTGFIPIQISIQKFQKNKHVIVSFQLNKKLSDIFIRGNKK